MKHVMIAIPAYTGVVHMGTMRSLINDTIELVKRGDRFTLVDDIGNALIADSRGVIATRFWESDCDELIFIDSDVTWQAGALLKLIDAPVDLVAGIYPTRRDPINYMVHYLDKKELWADPETGLLEVKSVPTGFMKLSRNCISKMIEAYPQKHYYTAERDKEFYSLFDHVFEDGYKCIWFVENYLNESVFKEEEIVTLYEYRRILKTEEREDKINKILDL
jgi:hypothetical protein